MGFTRDAIKSEADKNFQGLDIDDAPNGKLTLRSMLRCSDEEQKRIRKATDAVQGMQDDPNAETEQVRGHITDAMAVAAGSRADDLREYLGEFDLSEVMTVFLVWSEQTQAPKAQQSSKSANSTATR